MQNSKEINPPPEFLNQKEIQILDTQNTPVNDINKKNKWWVLGAIGAGTFMTALDTSVVNTILPVIKDDFRTNVATIEWVVVVYLLLVSGLLPIFGRLGDIHGHKKIYISGFLIFICSSLFCGLSASVFMLIGFRALQALGAAMLSSNSPAILTKSFPSTQRGQALGLQATMTYLGLVTGPSLGGWLAQQINWRTVFYINLPVGIFALMLSVLFIHKDNQKKSEDGFDISGAALFMSGLIVLLLGLNQGHNWGWSSPLTIIALSLSVILLGIFIKTERNIPNPMLDMTLFKHRLFTASISSAIINYICVYSIIFLMPFYLIQGRDLNPAQAGIILTAQPIVMAIIAPISGTLSDKIGTRLPTIIGMVLLSGGLWTLSRLRPETPLSIVFLSLGFTGLGVGIFISPNNSALMGSASFHRQGIAAGILATARNVGMVLGVGISGAIFTTVLSHGEIQNTNLLFMAIQLSFMSAFMIALVGIAVSAIRGKDTGNEVIQQKTV